MTVTGRNWLALCLVTESNQPEEWPYIAAVVFNRVASPRYPATLEKVILQPKQFSAFNEYTTKTSLQMYPAAALFRRIANGNSADRLLLVVAMDVVSLMAPNPAPEITPETLHYYSPISMVPKGSAPPWAKSAKRLFTPEGIDPQRFVFAEGVA